MYESMQPAVRRTRILSTNDIVSFPLFALALWSCILCGPLLIFEEVLAYVSFIW
jgi:hypothetical protein